VRGERAVLLREEGMSLWVPSASVFSGDEMINVAMRGEMAQLR